MRWVTIPFQLASIYKAMVSPSNSSIGSLPDSTAMLWRSWASAPFHGAAWPCPHRPFPQHQCSALGSRHRMPLQGCLHDKWNKDAQKFQLYSIFLNMQTGFYLFFFFVLSSQLYDTVIEQEIDQCAWTAILRPLILTAVFMIWIYLFQALTYFFSTLIRW